MVIPYTRTSTTDIANHWHFSCGGQDNANVHHNGYVEDYRGEVYMTPIKKIHQACFLACIESFLIDHGVGIRQECMISVLKNLGLCSDLGVVNRGSEDKVCGILKIRFSDIPYHYPIDKQYFEGPLLIGLNEHCVRFGRQDDESKIVIMDPDIGDFRCLDKADLEKSKPKFHKIELMPDRSFTGWGW